MKKINKWIDSAEHKDGQYFINGRRFTINQWEKYLKDHGDPITRGAVHGRMKKHHMTFFQALTTPKTPDGCRIGEEIPRAGLYSQPDKVQNEHQELSAVNRMKW